MCLFHRHGWAHGLVSGHTGDKPMKTTLTPRVLAVLAAGVLATTGAAWAKVSPEEADK